MDCIPDIHFPLLITWDFYDVNEKRFTYCHVYGGYAWRWLDDWILLALLLQSLLITFNHNTIAILHTLQSLHTNPLSLFPIVFTIRFLARIYNTWTIKVSLKYTLPISLHYGTLEVFTSHVKSPIVHCLLPTELLPSGFGIHFLWVLCTDPAENTPPLLRYVTARLPSSEL
jgi:hypothetical protein